MAPESVGHRLDGRREVDGGEHGVVVEDGKLGHGAPRYPWPAVARRPRIELHAPGASPEEAAAVVAALERFMRDTAPAPQTAAPRPPAWLRTALLEGVQRAPAGLTPWGDGHPWGHAGP